MPDLINPAYNQGRKEFRIWADELCKSCLEQDNCPLFQVLHKYTILTLSGLHVASCTLYNPDRESEYYLPPDADAEAIKGINVKQLDQQLAILTEKLERFNEDTLP